jgi:PKD repeat protein
MQRALLAMIATAVALATAACGGGGSVPSNDRPGLSPLDFDITTAPGSVPNAAGVDGWEVDLDDPEYVSAMEVIPNGYEAVGAILLEPEKAPGSGFEGHVTARIDDRTASAMASSAGSGVVYRFTWDSAKDLPPTIQRAGTYVKGADGSFSFDLDFLGYILLAQPTSPEFSVSAFADLSVAPVNTTINFHAIGRNGAEPYSFSWDFGDGETATGAEVSHSYPLIGDYSVTLSAVDADGVTAPVASTPITITANAAALTAVTVAVEETAPGEFTYNATLNGGTPPFNYAWDFDGDGTVDDTSGASVSWTAADELLFEGALSVTDQTGTEVSDNFVSDNRRLTLSVDVSSGFAPLAVNFTLAGTGPDDEVVLDFGTGETQSNPPSPAPYTYSDFTGLGLKFASATATQTVDGVDYVVSSNEVQIEVIERPAPRIDSVAPLRARVGQTVTITGEFFYAQETGHEVLLNGVPMPVVTWEPTVIEFTVAPGATDGDVVVSKERDSNGVHLDVIPETPGGPDLGQL